MVRSLLALVGLAGLASATPLLYDGRTPYNYTNDDLNNSVDPYLSVVKGSTENATYYTTLLGHSLNPTPLWNNYLVPWLPFPILSYPTEQPVTIAIDNTSIFIPGGTPPEPQNGFRRTELIAQKNDNHTALNGVTDVGTTVFHVSIRADDALPLNMTHEYQIVWIEPNDGSHVFEIQLGSPFTDPTGPLPVADAHYLKVRNHALDLLFETPFTSGDWHNFAVQIDWTQLTLGVFYSTNDQPLEAVTGIEDNSSTPAGVAGQGDYHFGVLKLPLVDPSETPSEQADVVHYGIQEGDKEALTYSGVFIESIEGGVSAGWGKTISSIV
ncbi:glycoside hydrolase family 131 protein [Hydnomerulius pinastri MD-312]|uniref:Glycoside hydrolase family 131 protein n=1 Tax=Hydnomerulius pinastri MD-312 TaxID=994086 RepID=A0A0C9W0A9_9AGAM|nr:glycoside hydrolase family 131 protein [Hydnomerulius pinastri MD-312]